MSTCRFCSKTNLRWKQEPSADWRLYDGEVMHVCPVNPLADYQEYLESAHWAWISTKKLMQHGSFCALCKAEDSITVHHIRYRELFNVKLSDLVVLCWPCHKRLHFAAERFSVKLTGMGLRGMKTLLRKFTAEG